jgi:hypothetical protein
VAVSLAFVGQRAFFEIDSLEHPADGIVPSFIDFRHGADPRPLREQLDAIDPDVIFVWRPEIIPPGFLRDSRARRIGYLTEPLPRPGGNGHPDLDIRMGNLRRTDPHNFDRIASFDPLVVPTVEEVVPVWRSFPIPVSDRFFAAPRPATGPPRLLFTGRSTGHREAFLGPVKKDFDCIHLAHGVTDDRLIEFMGEVDIGINLHNEPYPTFENRVSVYLAAGLLVLTEPLSPRHGLIPGVDLVEADEPWKLWDVVRQIARAPDAFAGVRANGHRKAQRFRASRVYPALVRDVLADVALFGTPRRPPSTVTVTPA